MKIKIEGRYLNIIGLLLGMIGVVIIFFYGPPQPSFFPYDIITDDNIHKEVLEMKGRYELCSKIGLGFIFIGFLLQLFGSIYKDKSAKNVEKVIKTPDSASNANAKDSIRK